MEIEKKKKLILVTGSSSQINAAVNEKSRQTDGLITAKRIIIAKSYGNFQVSHISTCSLVIKKM